MLQRLRGDIGNQRRRRRRANLVGDHPQYLALGAHAQHRAQEIGTVRGIHPGGTEDQVAATGGADGLLPGQLAGAIHAERRGGVVLPVRARALPVKHIVGGVMHQRHARGRAPARDHAGGLGIGTPGSITLLFGAVHRRVGGSVDDHVRAQAIQQRGQRSGQVEIGRFAGAGIGQRATARGRHDRAQRRQRTTQFLAQLAVAAEQQHGHGWYTGRRSSAMSFRNGALSSFADSVGALIGQSTAMSASFQRMPASCSFTYTSVHR
ncbi:hypothetical protein D3C71_1158070 [compost metagenome]